MSIVDAIPCEWRQIIRQSTIHLPSNIGDSIQLKIENSEVALTNVSSKLLYRAFKSKKQVPPTAQKKFKEKFPQFRLTGRKYTPCLLQSRVKLKLGNSNIKY